MLGALRNGVYRRLFVAQVLSLIGSGLTTVALGLLAYDLAGGDAGRVLGTALAIKMVAYVTTAPVAAALVGGVARKPLLVGLDLARAALVVLLPLVTAVWQVYVLVFAFQALSAAFTPTFQATIPDVLPDERDYAAALSLSRVAYDLEALVSPLLAAALLTVIAFEALFAGNALGFLASAALVLGTALPRAAASAPARPFSARLVRGGWIYLRTPRLRGLLALSLAAACAGAMVIVNTVVLVRDELGGSDRDVALLFAAYGLGSMLAALALPRALTRVSPRTAMLSGGALLACALPLGASGPGLGAAAGLWFVLGLGGGLVQTPAGLLLARSSHVEDRPAVYAAQFALSHAAWLVAYPTAGLVGASFGLPSAFLVLTLGAAAGVLAAACVWPRRESAELVHEHAAIEHDHPIEEDDHHRHRAVHRLGATRHRHRPLRHAHAFVIDDHHPSWPRR